MSDLAPNPNTTPTSTAPTPTPEPAPLEPSKTALTEPAPEPFDAEKLEVPEEIDRKSENFTKFIEFAKAQGFNQAQAKDLVAMHHAALKATSDAIYGEWKEQNAKWVDEVKADPEVGGSNFEKVRQTVAKVLDNPELSDPKFREALDFTGAGNHPAVVRTLFKWASRLTEGDSITGSPPPRDNQGRTVERPDPGRSFYGPAGPHTGGPKV